MELLPGEQRLRKWLDAQLMSLGKWSSECENIVRGGIITDRTVVQLVRAIVS